MSKVFLNIIKISLLLCAVVATGCSRPKTIPDETLETIFKEIYLANAYCETHSIVTDSTDIYDPILGKYGYNVKDMTSTIKGFTRRKSSRLSDIIDNAIKQLDEEYGVYEHRVAILDTVDLIAGEKYKEVVRKDSIIVASRVRDTAKLRITIPVKEGSYSIAYNYLIDTLEKNSGLRVTHFVYDSAGRQTSYNTNWMAVDKRQTYTVKLDTKPSDRKLVLLFGNYPRKEMKRPNIRIDSLYVVYYLPVKVARDSLAKSLLDYKLLIDGTEYDKAAQDSCSRHIHPPRIAEKRDSIR